MGTTTESEVEKFSDSFLFDFSERFDAIRQQHLRQDLKLIFVYTCRELHVFGERASNLFEAFMTYRSTVRVPEKIMENARFLPEEVEETVPVVLVAAPAPKTKIVVRGESTRLDRHELQLPTRDRE